MLLSNYMKNLFFFGFIVCSLFASAQNCSFNDSIFASIVSTQNLNDSRIQVFSYDSLSKISTKVILDTDNNGIISINEAKKAYSIFISDGPTNPIKTLNGISCFSEMVKLSLTGMAVDTILIANQKLKNFNVISNIGIKYIDVSNTKIDTLIASSNSILSKIRCNNNLSLQVVDCATNPALNSIQVQNCPNLKVFSSMNSQLTSVDVSTNSVLRNFIVKQNQIKKLSLANNPQLQIVVLDENPMDTIDLQKQQELVVFSCTNTNLTSVDVSSNKKLSTLDVSNNSKLFWVNLKNGRNVKDVYFSNLPTLKYVCTDDLNKKTLLDSLKNKGLSSVEVNTYCTNTPGGDYNRVRGKIRFDANANGCDNNDTLKLRYTKFALQDFNKTTYSFSTELNEVSFYTPAGNYILKPLMDTNYFKSFPLQSSILFSDSLNRDTLVNFCLSAKNSLKDVEVLMVPNGTALIGGTISYDILVRNKASVSTNGTIDLFFNDSLQSFQNSSFFSLVSNGKLTSNFSNLMPFETRKFSVIFKVKNLLEKPSIHLNDSLLYQVSVTIDGLDFVVHDNTFNFSSQIADSIKSNYILPLNGSTIPLEKAPMTFNYYIDFENPTKNTIENEVVHQEIDASKLDVKSLEVIESSSPVKIDVKDNNVTCYYANNKIGEHKHGNILLRYHGLKEFIINDTLFQKAEIFFDYNPPIKTNVSSIMFKKKLIAGLISEGLKLDESILAFPNPTNGIISLKSSREIRSIQIFSLDGKIVDTHFLSSANLFDLTNLEAGIYLIKVTTDFGGKVLEIIKN